MEATRHPPATSYQTDFPPEEFIARRAKVAEAIGSSALAVMRGAGASGAFDVFRQHNEFYYLCGVEVPLAYLVLDGSSGRTTLYLPRRNPKHEQSEGAQLAAEDIELVEELTGVDALKPLEAVPADIAAARVIYTPYAPAEGRQACRDVLLNAENANGADPLYAGTPAELFRRQLGRVSAGAELRDLSPVLDRLRTIKSPRELALLRRAGRLSAAAVNEAMKSTRPGLTEYQLAAVAEYVFLANGARGGGYRPIVASGANIWNAHYWHNNCVLRDTPFASGHHVKLGYQPCHPMWIWGRDSPRLASTGWR